MSQNESNCVWSFQNKFLEDFQPDVIVNLKGWFTAQRMLINRNAIFTPGHVVSSMKAI